MVPFLANDRAEGNNFQVIFPVLFPHAYSAGQKRGIFFPSAGREKCTSQSLDKQLGFTGSKFLSWLDVFNVLYFGVFF